MHLCERVVMSQSLQLTLLSWMFGFSASMLLIKKKRLCLSQARFTDSTLNRLRSQKCWQTSYTRSWVFMQNSRIKPWKTFNTVNSVNPVTTYCSLKLAKRQCLFSCWKLEHRHAERRSDCNPKLVDRKKMEEEKKKKEKKKGYTACEEDRIW